MYRAPPPTPIHLETRLTVEDYVDAQRLHMRPARSMRIFLRFTLPPVVAGLAYLFYDWIRGTPLIKHDWWLGPLLPALAALFFLHRYVMVPRLARRLFEQQKSLHHELTFDFDAEGMRVRSPWGVSTIPWSDFRKWKASRRLLVLFQSDVVINLVPLHALPDAATREALLSLVDKGIGPEA